MAQVKKTEEYGGLRRIMAERGLCNHALARVVGVSHTTIDRALGGTFVFWDRTERKVEKALGVGPGELRGPADLETVMESALKHLAQALRLLNKLDRAHAAKARRGK
jgi:hypothetical protein